MKRAIAMLMAVTLAGSVVSCGNGKKNDKNANSGKSVGIAMPTSTLDRWNSDGKFLQYRFESAGFDVDLRYSENDATRQNNDILAMINKGVDLLLIAAVDGTKLSGTLETAKEKGIPVVAYDRLIMDTHALTYYVSFDNRAVGRLQGEFVRDQLALDSGSDSYNIEFVAGDPADNNAKYFYDGAYDVLEPYIESGRLVIPSGKDSFDQVATPEWSMDKAKANMKDTLAKYYSNGTQLDVVLCANDSTALGAAQALNIVYNGKNYPIITGQDGDVANLKNIVDGKQAMTVYKNVRDEASVTYEVCKMILDGEIPTSKLVEKLPIDVSFDSESYNNGVKYVQSYLLLPSVITKDNMQLLVDCGLYEWDSAHKYLELTKTS